MWSIDRRTGKLQIQRMIREADNPNRRAFRDPDEHYGWLGEALEPSERARLRELLRARVAIVG